MPTIGHHCMMKPPLRTANKVIAVTAKERVKSEVKAFIDRLGLEWFLGGDSDRPNFKIKARSIEHCAMWLCEEKEIIEGDSQGGEIDFYLRIKNPEEFERYKRMVRREVLRYVKRALER
jgi:hypothetical protein